MADLSLAGVEQALRRGAGGRRPDASTCQRRVRRAARAERRRQDHDPAPRRRTRAAPTRGSVHIGGRDMTHAGAGAARRGLRVPAVLALPAPERLRQPGVPAALAAAAARREADVRRKVSEVARLLRIEDKLQSPATRLSGGQMQRVAIGRALVRDPALYLMDEPLSSLDAKLRNDLRLELKRIQQDLGATMLYVTHDQIEAMTMATRIGVLEQGAWCRSARRSRSTRIRPAPTSRRGSARRASTCSRARSCPASRAPPAAATVGVRAEHLRLHGASAASARPRGARAAHRTPRRPAPRARGARPASEQELVDRSAAAATAFEPGDAVQLELLRPLWFDAAGQRIAA